MMCNCQNFNQTVIIQSSKAMRKANMLDAGETSQESNLSRKFVPLGMIGHGSFSEVYKVRRLADGKIYALKKIKLHSLKPKEQEYALGEIKMLAALSCPYIVSFRQSFYDQTMQQLCIVMEWANEGDLQTEIERRRKQLEAERHPVKSVSANSKYYIPQSEIWRAVRDILSGLAVLHDTSILHRDIKAANIFKSDGIYKLGDLNIAKLCPGLAYAYTQTGTPYYASPEVWKQLPYDSKSDVWSFGCVIYQMCELSPPFTGGDMNRLYESVVKGRYAKINPHFYSKELSDLIDLCLKVDPKQRKSCRDILGLSQVLLKFQEYNIRDQYEECNNERRNLSDQLICQQQLSIKLTKQLRQIKSKTDPIGGLGMRTLHDSNLSPYACNKLNSVLPRPNYPSEKKRISTNQSYCFGTETSDRYEGQHLIDKQERCRPASCRTESAESKRGQQGRYQRGQKENQQTKEQPNKPTHEGHRVFTGRSLLQISQKKIAQQQKSKPITSTHNPTTCSQQQARVRHLNILPCANQGKEPMNYRSEKVEDPKLRRNHEINLRQVGPELIKKYKYKYKYKYAYNGVRPSSHNPNRKVAKQSGKEFNLGEVSTQQKHPTRAYSVTDLHPHSERLSSEQDKVHAKKEVAQDPLREIGLPNSKYRIKNMTNKANESSQAKVQKAGRGQILNRQEFQGQLPKIRYMLANRSSNIRQQIGKIYSNHSMAINYQHYVGSGYCHIGSGPYRAYP